MLTNKEVTIYHKTLNTSTKLEEYRREYFKNCWVFGGKGSLTNKGYENSNSVEIRIPYDANENAITGVFDIGDIIYVGKGPYDVEKQTDLNGEVYNITTITINSYGDNTHIHLGGK